MPPYILDELFTEYFIAHKTASLECSFAPPQFADSKVL